jgi:hypothetical protein
VDIGQVGGAHVRRWSSGRHPALGQRQARVSPLRETYRFRFFCAFLKPSAISSSFTAGKSVLFAAPNSREIEDF